MSKRLSQFVRMTKMSLVKMVSPKVSMVENLANILTFPILLPLTFVALVVCGVGVEDS